MKIEFDEQDVKRILIAEVKRLGMQANTVDIETGYSSLKRAVVSFEPPEPESEPTVVSHLPNEAITNRLP
jgi:hypothetical protein